MADVVISYAGPDEESARRVYSAISGRGYACWFAPESIRPGGRFPEEITAAINQCKVFVVLWSKHAARDDRHVLIEIDHAGDPKRKPRIVLMPVMMDETPRDSNYYLKSVTSVRWDNANAPARIAQAVHEHLAAPKAPYPLGTLFRQLSVGGLGLDDYIEAARLFIRFLTLIQIAWFVSGDAPSEEINRRIEAFLPVDSLFADLDLARAISEWMNRKRPTGESQVHFLRRAFNCRPPSAHQFDRQDLASPGFDRDYLYEMCEVPKPPEHASDDEKQEAERRLCGGILEFLRKALAEDWVRDLNLSVRSGGLRENNQWFLDRPIQLSSDDARQAELFLRMPGFPILLSPFVILVASHNPGEWEPGLLREQEETAEYSQMSIAKHQRTDLPPLVLPWARIEVVRSLPPVVYARETHQVRLAITNHASGDVVVAEILEKLPDNVSSAEGGPDVRVAENLMLSSGESRELGVFRRGERCAGHHALVSGGGCCFFISGTGAAAGDRRGPKDTRINHAASAPRGNA